MLKTKNGQEIAVEMFTTKDLVELLNKEFSGFAEKLAKLNGKEDYAFYKASYPFGSKIIHNKECYLPLKDGGSISFNDPDLPEKLSRDLGYNPLTEDPLGFILSKNSELYLSTGDSILSYGMMSPGQMFGIPRATADTDSDSIESSSLSWNCNAGVRSIFMLYTVFSKEKHSRLQSKYKTKVAAPTSLEDQWRVFADIVKQSDCPWRCEIIFFSRSWIKALVEPEWSAMRVYMMLQHRSSYTIWHNKSQLWQKTFSDIERDKSLTYHSSYALATARQLFFIAANSAPAFRPAIDGDISAPISLLREAYALGYGLATKNQSTVIMELTNFDAHGGDVYYSLNYPILAQNNPESFKGRTFVLLLEKIMIAAKTYKEQILLREDKDSTLYKVASTTEFTYYHPDPEDHVGILVDKDVSVHDPRFIQNGCGEFPHDSIFCKGFIRISRK